jgi:adenine-specific DNA-methyltransferase
MNTDFYEFEKAIDELYKIMIQPIHEYYKAAAVQNCRLELGIDKVSSFSEKYTSVIKDSKEMGAVYTPAEISGYIIRNTISQSDIIQNPFLKIVDPACGTGNIILPCFLILEQIYSESLDEINEMHSLKLSKENLAKHILDYNLFGYDLDRLALRVLAADLFCKAGYYNAGNFRAEDFLTSEIGEMYDVFIGNPPYIGHKTVDKRYSRELKERFKEIYTDKGDISYCFFQRSIDLIKGNGKLSFITSRYFIESPSGTALRRLLARDAALSRIVDFYGIRPFKGVGIDPAIIFMDFGRKGAEGFEVIKPRSKAGKNDKNGFIQYLFLGKGSAYAQFAMKHKNLLDSGWILKSAEEMGILEKISGRCRLRLSDIADSYQGIITGCDKAFVLDRESAAEAGIEEELLKPWIKSSGIEKNRVNPAAVFIIYSDLIDDEAKYPNAMRFIGRHREKLMNRRECRTGARKWHMLQWGRKSGIFEGRKIVFPYKATGNRFAVDQGSYFSADVYALVLREGSGISLEKLLRLLNSRTYEFYFKSFAKKLGEDQYEYYPNNLMKLLLPDDLKEEFRCEEEIYRYFGFTDREVDIIEKSLSS